MKKQIRVVTMSLDGHEIPVTLGISELLNNVNCWVREKPVESGFLKSYSRRAERASNGSLVTVYEKNNIYTQNKIAQ